MPGVGPSLQTLNEDNRGPIIVIVAYSWVAISVIVAIIRFGLTWRQSHLQRFKVEDGTFLLGVVGIIFSYGCCVLTRRRV